ncbi:hypothetical protein ACWPM1_14490 [Tsuneonella sp. HG249]
MDLTTPSATDPMALALERELQPGERVLWSGRRLARVSWGGLGIWLFAVPWTAFSLSWMAGASMGAQAASGTIGVLSWAFPLFGLPFVLVGLGMMAAPFLPLFGASRTLFAITDRRVLRIALFGSRLWTKSVELKEIREFSRSEGRNAEGDLRLDLGSTRDSEGDVRKASFSIGTVADVMAADRVLHAQLGLKASS